MAKFNGTLLGLYIVGSPSNKKIADVTNFDLTVNGEPIDVTTKDSGGWKEILMGLRSWSMSVEGVVDMQVTTASEQGVVELIAAEIARTQIDLIGTNLVTGDKSYAGAGFITNVNVSAPMEGTVTFTCDFEGTGALTPATIA